MKFQEFPYKEFQALEAWRVIDNVIEQLVENKDLVETTPRRYIVGSILKQLSDNKMLKENVVKHDAM